MVVAHELIEDLGAKHVHLVLELLLGEVESVAERDLCALQVFSRRVAHELGDDHAARVQLGEILEAAAALPRGGGEASLARQRYRLRP